MKTGGCQGSVFWEENTFGLLYQQLAGVEQLRSVITHKNQWCFASSEYAEVQIKFKSAICGEWQIWVCSLIKAASKTCVKTLWTAFMDFFFTLLELHIIIFCCGEKGSLDNVLNISFCVQQLHHILLERLDDEWIMTELFPWCVLDLWTINSDLF